MAICKTSVLALFPASKLQILSFEKTLKYSSVFRLRHLEEGLMKRDLYSSWVKLRVMKNIRQGNNEYTLHQDSCEAK